MANNKINSDAEFFSAIDDIVERAALVDTLKAQQAQAQIALNLEWGKKIDAVQKPLKSSFSAVKNYAVKNRTRLLGNEKSASTAAAVWGFRDSPSKVIPIIKTTDAAMIEQLRALSNNRGAEYLTVSYSLDKSKIADALANGVRWICSLFKQTKNEVFFADKIKKNAEEK